jgi:hypothetical protein
MIAFTGGEALLESGPCFVGHRDFRADEKLSDALGVGNEINLRLNNKKKRRRLASSDPIAGE